MRGARTGDGAVAAAMALGKRLRKTTVLAGDAFGFIGNRMLEPYLHEALFLLEEGASVSSVDEAMRNFGMAMGPFAMSDLAGNDIGYNVRVELGWAGDERRAAAREPTRRYWGTLADELVSRGRLGQKTKAGWYDYSSGGRTPVPDPEVDAMVAAMSEGLGVGRREISADEVLDRCLLPLVNEGFKIVQEGIAQRESDLNIVYLYGYGFPRKSGGPMHWARHVRAGGLPKVVADLRSYAAAHPNVPHWEPCALLLEQAEKAAAHESKL